MMYGQVTASDVRGILPGTEMEVKCEDCKWVFVATVSDINLVNGAMGKILWFDHHGHCPRCGSTAPGASYTPE